ncbi:hypothetical protein RJ641_002898 [Dillenia turbinata]|uniref:Uncharacterized protein n=1 Tax=Dillenia turbinata TaxID=194707 RepID=A0AAN8VBI8_9MAGN
MATCGVPFSLRFASVTSPAKTPVRRDLSLILHRRSHPSSALSFLSFSAKPISGNVFNFPIRALAEQNCAYPDPIPEFAKSEREKFRVELLQKLSMDKDTFGDELDAVVDVCTEIFGEFLHKEYGGPGTLLVEPFTDMLVVLKEKKLPGAPLAARASLLWAQNNVDDDWEVWNSKQPN